MYVFSLIEIITNKLEIEKDINKISIIDFIKFFKNYYNVMSIIKNFKNPTDEERYIISVFSINKISEQKYLLSQNYFNNLFLDIYFILGNPFSIDTFQFDDLYKNKEIINEIPRILIDIYDKLMEDKLLYKYYNIDLIKRWENTIIQKPVSYKEYKKISKLSDEDKIKKWNEYNNIFLIYNDNCLRFKKYLQEIILAQFGFN